MNVTERLRKHYQSQFLDYPWMYPMDRGYAKAVSWTKCVYHTE